MNFKKGLFTETENGCQMVNPNDFSNNLYYLINNAIIKGIPQMKDSTIDNSINSQKIVSSKYIEILLNLLK